MGLTTSAAVVLLAVVATSTQASSSPPSHATSAVAVAAAAPAAAVAAVTPVAAVVAADDLYDRAASTCPGLPATVLAAIHQVETRSSRFGGAVSTAGALGPMQFLPSTWAAYGVDADGDGRADINDLDDAVFTAAKYLCANGGNDPNTLRSALWNYNHSWDYVDTVIAEAAA